MLQAVLCTVDVVLISCTYVMFLDHHQHDNNQHPSMYIMLYCLAVSNCTPCLFVASEADHHCSVSNAEIGLGVR